MPRQFDVILNCIMTESENISSKFTILIFLSEFLKRIKKVIHAPVNHLLIITILMSTEQLPFLNHCKFLTAFETTTKNCKKNLTDFS